MRGREGFRRRDRSPWASTRDGCIVEAEEGGAENGGPQRLEDSFARADLVAPLTLLGTERYLPRMGGLTE